MLTIYQQAILPAPAHISDRTLWLDGDPIPLRKLRTWGKKVIADEHVAPVVNEGKDMTDKRMNEAVNSIEAACQTSTSPPGSIQQPAL